MRARQPRLTTTRNNGYEITRLGQKRKAAERNRKFEGEFEDGPPQKKDAVEQEKHECLKLELSVKTKRLNENPGKHGIHEPQKTRNYVAG